MDNQPIQPVKKFRCPITPYQLFTPVASVFLDNLTYEEQLLGLFKAYNSLVSPLNQLIKDVNSLQQLATELGTTVEQLQSDFLNLKTYVENQIVNLSILIATGDKETLDAAKQYTDFKINGIGTYGSITAGEYDDLHLTADKYSSYEMTALQYDRSAKIILMGFGDSQLTDEEIQKLQQLPPIKTIGDNLTLTSDGTLNADISPSDPQLTEEEVTKVQDLPAIKSIGTNLELTDDGTLNATGGSSIGLLNTYSSSQLDANSAGFINTKLNGNEVLLGTNAKHTWTSTQNVGIGNNVDTQSSNTSNPGYNVAIGYNAQTTYRGSTAIGSRAAATGLNTTAIGGGETGSSITPTTAFGSYSTAIGHSAVANHQGSTALGYNSTTTRTNEVSIGKTNVLRYLANVKAAELETDAVNLKQMQDYVAANAGGSSTGTLVLNNGYMNNVETGEQDLITALDLQPGKIYLLKLALLMTTSNMSFRFKTIWNDGSSYDISPVFDDPMSLCIDIPINTKFHEMDTFTKITIVPSDDNTNWRYLQAYATLSEML